MNQRIKNIIFDWGGVLIDLNMEGCIRAFEEEGIRDVRSLLTGTNEQGIFRAYESGLLTTPEFRNAIREMSGKQIPDADIDRIWNMELLSIPPQKLELLSRLSQSHRLFLLSNTNELHWKYGSSYAFSLDGQDMKTCFERIFLSFQMHLVKPDPAIFRTALHEAGLSPEETLFIDDSESNCHAAASLGIQTVHYVPGTDLSALFL